MPRFFRLLGAPMIWSLTQRLQCKPGKKAFCVDYLFFLHFSKRRKGPFPGWSGAKPWEAWALQDKIAYVEKIGDFYYNFWQDANHVKGIWRRCTLEEYRKSAADINWELVLDLDELSSRAKDEKRACWEACS